MEKPSKEFLERATEMEPELIEGGSDAFDADAFLDDEDPEDEGA